MRPLLLIVRHRMPVIVDGFGLVVDRDARVLQPVTEFEILVPVAGEGFVEAADAVEIVAPHRALPVRKYSHVSRLRVGGCSGSRSAAFALLRW